MSVRGRFAPSPTGRMHLGNAWAALLCWLAVRQAGGAMVLRIEDLDPDRSRPEYEKGLVEDLTWLGLTWDEGPDVGGPYGPYRQSERLGYYETVLSDLEQRNLVYPCTCTRKELRTLASAPHQGEEQPSYPGTCRNITAEQRVSRIAAAMACGRKPAMRLWCPADPVPYTDMRLGIQAMVPPTGDFALRRSDGVYAYQLAVVADDVAMDISLVVRGDDLVASTPGQALLFRLLNRQPPLFLHVPLLVDQDDVRLSKRHGSLEIAALRACGISPETITGWLGWQAGLLSDFQPASPSQLLPEFAPHKLPKSRVSVDCSNLPALLRMI